MFHNLLMYSGNVKDSEMPIADWLPYPPLLYINIGVGLRVRIKPWCGKGVVTSMLVTDVINNSWWWQLWNSDCDRLQNIINISKKVTSMMILATKIFKTVATKTSLTSLSPMESRILLGVEFYLTRLYFLGYGFLNEC